MQTSHIPQLLAGGFLLMGLVLTVTGLVAGIRHLRRLRSWHRVRGTVTGYEWRGSSDSQTQHWHISHTDAAGAIHSTVTGWGTSGGTLRSFPFDEDMLVNPDDPDDFCLAGGTRSGQMGFVLAAGGLAFTAIGGALLGLMTGLS